MGIDHDGQVGLLGEFQNGIPARGSHQVHQKMVGKSRIKPSARCSLKHPRNAGNYMGVSENVVYPIVPNGFADQTIPFLSG